MPHFSESELEEVKRMNRLEDVARASGCELKKHGVNKLVTLCRFHKENTPSLVIDVVRNTFKCFGCGKGGDVITWVMETEGRSFTEAVAALGGMSQTRAGGLGLGAEKESRKSTIRTEQLFDPEMMAEEMLERTAQYYHEVGLEAPELREYLVRRGLLPKDADEELLHSPGSILNVFKLGYANRTLGLKVEKGDRVGGAEVRRKLQEIGVVRSSGHEHLAGSLVVPILDEEGRVVQLYGRKILDNLRQGTPKHLYLAGQLKGIFNIQGFRVQGSGFERQGFGVQGSGSGDPVNQITDGSPAPQSSSVNAGSDRLNPEPRTLILCEAILDALTFWVHGFKNVTACFGVTNFTEELLQFIVKYCFTVVYLAFDPDEPGDRGALAVAEKLAQFGIECRRVKFPPGLDANEFALKVSNPTKALGELLDLAESLPQGERKAGSVAATQNHPVSTSPIRSSTKPQAPSPISSAPSPQPPTLSPMLNPDDFTLTQGDRSYRIRGLAKSLSPGVMKVNLRVVRGDDIHLDTLDLCSHKQREQFARAAAIALNVKPEQIGNDLKRVLVTAEDIQDEQVTLALTPKPKVTELTDDERAEALEFLRSPDLIGRIVEGFAACGVVGEETNLLVGYLGAVSRLLERPLGILIQSSSAAGKTSLMDAVLAMMPKEAKVKYSAMTGQSLFYMGDMDLRHKILAIAEEEGAKRAEYSLKVLQSEGELTMAATGKNTQTGLLTTHQYEVKGPVMLFSTTTTIEIDEELLNRCIILTVNEDRAQTRAIHQRQRERYTVEGLWAKDDAARIRKLHQNAQRLLHPLEVVNPFARHLTFLDDKTRTRRDHEKYLTLIGAIALLHQHQRPIKQTVRGGRTKDYIEVQLSDIALANRLANEVLGRSLDELPPQTRQLLMKLDDWVRRECDRLNLRREDFHFTRRALREALGWHDTQLRIHLERLVLLEYVLVHRGGRGQQFVYELLYDGSGQDGKLFVMNLIDVAALNRTPTDTSRGEEATVAGSNRAENGPKTAGLRSGFAPVQDGGNGGFHTEVPKNAYQEAFELAASYIRNGHSSSSATGGK